MTKKYTPHVHAEVIKAWADGKAIEFRPGSDYKWKDTDSPRWIHLYQYRVKPEEVVDFAPIHHNGIPGAQFFKSIINLKTYFEHPEEFQGYLKRTRIDGKVVSFEFISQ